MRALIVGSSGQDGHYLREHLAGEGVEVIGVSRREGPRGGVDVADRDAVFALVRDLRPDFVFHLAARSTTRHDALFDNHSAISTGALNVLEAVRLHAPDARVFLTGSGVQFRNSGAPIGEDDEFEASSPYSVSRIHSVYAARYFRRLGVRAYVGYLFHHDSPLRGSGHVSSIVASAAARIAAGSAETLEIGDASVEKEWTFAGDVAAGMWTLVRQDACAEAVIGSGVAHSIRDWLAACFGAVGLEWSHHVRVKQGFTPEYRRLVSNPARIRALGWAPKVGFEELAGLMVGAEAARLAQGPQ
jgi:GDPmannose 4,6-dehydratase